MRALIMGAASAFLLIATPIFSHAEPVSKIAEKCLAGGPGSGSCETLYINVYLSAQVAKELQRMNLDRQIPACWEGNRCPVTLSEVLGSVGDDETEIRRKFGEPSPQLKFISYQSQLAAAEVTRAALLRSLDVVDTDIKRIKKLAGM